jgi:signal recognition particle subunit SRP54
VLQDVIPEDKQPELLDSIQRGNVSMRVMRDVFESFLNMGPLSQVRGSTAAADATADVVSKHACDELVCLLWAGAAELMTGRQMRVMAPVVLSAWHSCGSALFFHLSMALSQGSGGCI